MRVKLFLLMMWLCICGCGDENLSSLIEAIDPSSRIAVQTSLPPEVWAALEIQAAEDAEWLKGILSADAEDDPTDEQEG